MPLGDLLQSIFGMAGDATQGDPGGVQEGLGGLDINSLLGPQQQDPEREAAFNAILARVMQQLEQGDAGQPQFQFQQPSIPSQVARGFGDAIGAGMTVDARTGQDASPIIAQREAANQAEFNRQLQEFQVNQGQTRGQFGTLASLLQTLKPPDPGANIGRLAALLNSGANVGRTGVGFFKEAQEQQSAQAFTRGAAEQGIPQLDQQIAALEAQADETLAGDLLPGLRSRLNDVKGLIAQAQQSPSPELTKIARDAMIDLRKDVFDANLKTLDIAKAVPGTLLNDTTDYAVMVGSADQTLKFLDEIRPTTGPLVGRIAKTIGFNPSVAQILALSPNVTRQQAERVARELNVLNATLTNMNSFLINLRSGAQVSDREFERLQGMLSDIRQNPEVAADRLRALRAFFRAKVNGGRAQIVGRFISGRDFDRIMGTAQGGFSLFEGFEPQQPQHFSAPRGTVDTGITGADLNGNER